MPNDAPNDNPSGDSEPASSTVAARFQRRVLDAIKSAFVGKDELVDLLGVSLVAGENLFILGPPGTAKSAVVRELTQRLDGRMFDYLLTRFSEPNELFGPFDIRKLRDGDLVTNTEGMLPEADFVFLDELLNANSAILNSLLMVLNERVFRRGRENRQLPTLMVVGASNNLPEDPALGALFDRFLLRVNCENVPGEMMTHVLEAGWKLENRGIQNGDEPEENISVADVRQLQQQVRQVDLNTIRENYVALVHRLRHAGISISDRRAVKLQRLIAASAVLCDRSVAQMSDLWVLRYIWDTREQQDVLTAIVQDATSEATNELQAHPRSQGDDRPNPEELARDLERLQQRIADDKLPETDFVFLRDQLGLLAARVQWVDGEQQRTFLQSRVEELLGQLEAKT